MKILSLIFQMTLGLAPVAAFAAPGASNAILNPAVFKSLEDIAHDQAQIWGDTILEGDYELTGPVRLDSAQVVSAGTRITGYRIVFSASAKSPEGHGRISEAAWVGADLKTIRPDPAHPATFQVIPR